MNIKLIESTFKFQENIQFLMESLGVAQYVLEESDGEQGSAFEHPYSLIKYLSRIVRNYKVHIELKAMFMIHVIETYARYHQNDEKTLSFTTTYMRNMCSTDIRMFARALLEELKQKKCSIPKYFQTLGNAAWWPDAQDLLIQYYSDQPIDCAEQNLRVLYKIAFLNDHRCAEVEILFKKYFPKQNIWFGAWVSAIFPNIPTLQKSLQSY